MLGGDMFAVWRMEFQERGAPHFHVMLWVRPTLLMTSLKGQAAKFMKDCEAVLPYKREGLEKMMRGEWRSGKHHMIAYATYAWARATGIRGEPLRNMVDVECVKGYWGAVGYLSKYIAKVSGHDAEGEQLELYRHAGRVWGRMGNIAMAKPDVLCIEKYTMLAWTIEKELVIRDLEGNAYAVARLSGDDESFFAFISDDERERLIQTLGAYRAHVAQMGGYDEWVAALGDAVEVEFLRVERNIAAFDRVAVGSWDDEATDRG
jgi:hypothetical protein